MKSRKLETHTRNTEATPIIRVKCHSRLRPLNCLVGAFRNLDPVENYALVNTKASCTEIFAKLPQDRKRTFLERFAKWDPPRSANCIIQNEKAPRNQDHGALVFRVGGFYANLTPIFLTSRLIVEIKRISRKESCLHY